MVAAGSAAAAATLVLLLKGRKSGDAAVVEVLRRMPAHKKGTPMDQIETPALCVDLDLLDQNMAKMKASMEPFKGKVTVRPHIKSHKWLDRRDADRPQGRGLR